MVLAVVATLAAFLIGRDDDEGQPQQAETTTTTARAVDTSRFATYEDKDAGFSLKHPRGWTVLAGPEIPGPVDNAPPGRLHQRVVFGAGGLDGLKIQVARIEKPVTSRSNVDDIKAFTDAIFAEQIAPGTALNIQHASVTVNGMPGYYYLYTFRDEASGQDGAHAHYFLFQDRSMFTLVFQALPADRFQELAQVFDAVAESFKADPEVTR